MKRVFFKDFQQDLRFWPQARCGNFFSVLLRLSGVNQLPAYHLMSLAQREIGVFRPWRIDLRIPGMESK